MCAFYSNTDFYDDVVHDGNAYNEMVAYLNVSMEPGRSGFIP